MGRMTELEKSVRRRTRSPFDVLLGLRGRALNVFNCPLGLDHVIIGNPSYSSLRELGCFYN